ncbi:hypothetical protein C8F01DRAFT_676234 [Mycena amicta]|nr:hypothetical protein C8F01DRAFT_676234 [Mycena amicta]
MVRLYVMMELISPSLVPSSPKCESSNPQLRFECNLDEIHTLGAQCSTCACACPRAGGIEAPNSQRQLQPQQASGSFRCLRTHARGRPARKQTNSVPQKALRIVVCGDKITRSFHVTLKALSCAIVRCITPWMVWLTGHPEINSTRRRGAEMWEYRFSEDAGLPRSCASAHGEYISGNANIIWMSWTFVTCHLRSRSSRLFIG